MPRTSAALLRNADRLLEERAGRNRVDLPFTAVIVLALGEKRPNAGVTVT